MLLVRGIALAKRAAERWKCGRRNIFKSLDSCVVPSGSCVGQPHVDAGDTLAKHLLGPKL
jgi:hypothetical protein